MQAVERVRQALNGPAAADDDADICRKRTGADVVAACTRAIGSGRYVGAGLAALYLNRGVRYKENGDLDRALADYDEAIRMSPKAAVLYYGRGNVWGAKGDVDRAIADYDQALRLDPNYVWAYNNRGNLWSKKGDLDRAIADYDQAIRLDGRSASTYLNRAEAWEDKGQLDRAIADYDEAIRLDPDLKHAYYYRGIAWSAKGDFERAIADYDQALRRDAKDAKVYQHRGAAWSAKGEFALAIADYDQAIRLDPSFGAAYWSRGLAYFNSGNFSAAAADMLKSNDLRDDGYSMLWRFLARARAGQDGSGELAANAARLKTKEWVYPVIDFYLGRRSLEEMRASAVKPEQKCEAAFYVGEWHLLHGNMPAAMTELKEAAATCPKNFAEHTAAVAELKRIGP